MRASGLWNGGRPVGCVEPAALASAQVTGRRQSTGRSVISRVPLRSVPQSRIILRRVPGPSPGQEISSTLALLIAWPRRDSCDQPPRVDTAGLLRLLTGLTALTPACILHSLIFIWILGIVHWCATTLPLAAASTRAHRGTDHGVFTLGGAWLRFRSRRLRQPCEPTARRPGSRRV